MRREKEVSTGENENKEEKEERMREISEEEGRRRCTK